MFRIVKKDKHTKARLGLLKTAHGTVKTPAYVIVATHGEIKTLKPSDIKKTKTQIVICNTYHLWDWALQRASLQSKDALCRRIGLNIPTMTDSGGFQVLSLAFDGKNKIGKIIQDTRLRSANEQARYPPPFRERAGKIQNINKTQRQNIRITDKGVYFKNNDRWKFLGPELSMQLQQRIGADIIFAFDHITSPLDSHTYNKKAVETTSRWAKTCLDTKYKIQNTRYKQMLFGIVQGGNFPDLREKSAKSIGAMPFDGFGIGGSYTKKQIAKVLKWVIPHLPEEKPRHLLGIGKIEDIFEAIENGVDTFDCVIPTREARHGRIWTAKGYYDIRKSENENKKIPLEKKCKCETCEKITRSKLRNLFKDRKTLFLAQRLTTIHNVYFFNNLLEQIRESIKKGKFRELKKKLLSNFVSNCPKTRF